MYGVKHPSTRNPVENSPVLGVTILSIETSPNKISGHMPHRSGTNFIPFRDEVVTHENSGHAEAK